MTFPNHQRYYYVWAETHKGYEFLVWEIPVLRITRMRDIKSHHLTLPLKQKAINDFVRKVNNRELNPEIRVCPIEVHMQCGFILLAYQ